MFGKDPVKVVNSAIKEMEELRDEGNTISALLILYMVSHDDLQKFANGRQYKRLISKYEKEIHWKLKQESTEKLFAGIQAFNLAKLSSKIIPETAFSKTLKEFTKR